MAVRVQTRVLRLIFRLFSDLSPVRSLTYDMYELARSFLLMFLYSDCVLFANARKCSKYNPRVRRHHEKCEDGRSASVKFMIARLMSTPRGPGRGVAPFIQAC